MDLRKLIQEKGNRAVFYGRHSTDEQDMAMQLDAFERFCKKYDCIVAGKYEDKGFSARKVPMKGRPKLAKLLEDVNRGLFDIVVAYADNRLARDPVEHVQIRLLLQGVPVILCDSETLYNPEHADLLSQVIRDGASKFEVDQTMERTRDTFISKVDRGQRIGGKLPFGYQLTKEKAFRNKKLVEVGYCKPLPEMIPVIRQIFRHYEKGNGFSAIAEELGWFKKSMKKNGKPEPNKERVKCIIINPFYAGYVSMYKVKAKSRLSVQDLRDWHLSPCAEITPVISYEQWLRCFELYKSRQKGEIAPRHYKTSFLLMGLLKCSCGKDMKGRNQIKGQYGRRSYYCKPCKVKIDAVNAEHEVIQKVYTDVLVRNETDREQLASFLRSNIEKEIQELKSLERQLNEEIDSGEGLMRKAKASLMEIIHTDSKDTIEILEDYRSTLRLENERLQAQGQELRKRRELLEKLNVDPKQIRDIQLSQIFETEHRRLFLELVEQITYSPGKGLDIQVRTKIH